MTRNFYHVCVRNYLLSSLAPIMKFKNQHLDYAMTFAAFTFLILLITPVPQASAYCWEPGKNPKFTGPPKVEQVNVRKVRVSWFGLVEMRDCADQFLVKYWPSSSPSNYMTTTLVNNDVNAIDVEVTPFVPYEFQAVAREDKGLIGGIGRILIYYDSRWEILSAKLSLY